MRSVTGTASKLVSREGSGRLSEGVRFSMGWVLESVSDIVLPLAGRQFKTTDHSIWTTMDGNQTKHGP